MTSGLRIIFITHSGVLRSRMPLGAGPINLVSGLWQATHIISYISFPFTASGRSISGSSSTEVTGPTPLFSRSTRSEALTWVVGAGGGVVVSGEVEDDSLSAFSFPHAIVNTINA